MKTRVLSSRDKWRRDLIDKLKSGEGFWVDYSVFADAVKVAKANSLPWKQMRKLPKGQEWSYGQVTEVHRYE